MEITTAPLCPYSFPLSYLESMYIISKPVTVADEWLNEKLRGVKV